MVKFINMTKSLYELYNALLIVKIGPPKPKLKHFKLDDDYSIAYTEKRS